MTIRSLTYLQLMTIKERRKVIERFQKKYKTLNAKKKALSKMTNNDINFLIYCMDNIHGKMFYSRYLEK